MSGASFFLPWTNFLRGETQGFCRATSVRYENVLVLLFLWNSERMVSNDNVALFSSLCSKNHNSKVRSFSQLQYLQIFPSSFLRGSSRVAARRQTFVGEIKRRRRDNDLGQWIESIQKGSNWLSWSKLGWSLLLLSGTTANHFMVQELISFFQSEGSLAQG